MKHGLRLATYKIDLCFLRHDLLVLATMDALMVVSECASADFGSLLKAPLGHSDAVVAYAAIKIKLACDHAEDSVAYNEQRPRSFRS